MKKLIAAISFLVYFAASSGIVINSHYCMKRLVSVHLFETKAKVCGKCGMKMHDNPGCCHDETKVVKLVQDQVKMPVTAFEIQAPDAPAGELPAFLVAYFSTRDERPVHRYHPPPLLSAQDTYLQIGVFRI